MTKIQDKMTWFNRGNCTLNDSPTPTGGAWGPGVVSGWCTGATDGGYKSKHFYIKKQALHHEVMKVQQSSHLCHSTRDSMR